MASQRSDRTADNAIMQSCHLPLIVLVISALASAGCMSVPAVPRDEAGRVAPEPNAQTKHNEHFDGIARARIGERVYVDGPYVTPLEVVKDSRCPSPLQCYVAGELHVKVRVDLGSRSVELVLKNHDPVHIADGNLRLVEATPESRIAKRGGTAAVPIAPQDYRFGFRFMGGY